VNSFHNGSNSIVVTQRSQLLLFVVGETCLAAPYMRASISRLSGDTSQYYDALVGNGSVKTFQHTTMGAVISVQLVELVRCS
jgi:hypothetical protein